MKRIKQKWANRKKAASSTNQSKGISLSRRSDSCIPMGKSGRVCPSPCEDTIQVENLEDCSAQEEPPAADDTDQTWTGDSKTTLSTISLEGEVEVEVEVEVERAMPYSLLGPGLSLYPDVTEGETLREKFDELRFLQRTLRLAAAHVEDALMGRGSLGKSRAMFLPKYQKICFTIFDNQWWRRLLFSIIIIHSILAVFEPTQDHIQPGETSPVVFILNAVCLIIYTVDVVLQMVFFQWKTFLKSAEARRARVEFLFTVMFTIDFVMLILQEIIENRLLQPFRCVRPAMLYAKSRNFSHIFDVCASIILSLGKVLLLVFLYVLVFAAAAVHLYMDNYHSINNNTVIPDPNRNASHGEPVYTGAFDHVGIAVLRMFVLISSENYPAIMIPAYQVHSANFIFFGVYVYVGLFVITSVLIAQVVEKYWYYSKQHIKAERMHERAELAKAWTLLDPDGEGHVTTQDRRVWQLLVYVRPTLREEEVQELVDYLDEDGDGDIDTFEWTTRLTDALNYDFIKDPKPWTVNSPKWLYSLTRRCRSIVTSPPFNVILIILIVIHSLLLCIKWYGMQPSTAVLIQGLRTGITSLFLVEIVLKVLGLGSDLYCTLEMFDLFCTIVGILCNFLWFLVPDVISVPDPVAYHAILVVVSGSAIFMRLGFNSRLTKKLLESFLKLAPVLLDLILFVVILIYFYAVLGMELFYGFPPDKSIDSDHWGYNCDLGFDTLGCSMLEVFQICTTSNWHEIMNAVMLATTAWSALYFVSCYCIVCMVVMNLFVAMTIEAFKHLIPTGDSEDDNRSVNIQHQAFSQHALSFLDAVFAASRTSVHPTDRRISLATMNERRRSLFPSPANTSNQDGVSTERQRHLSSTSVPITQETQGAPSPHADNIDRPRRSVAAKRRREKLIKERLARRKGQTGNKVRVIAAYRKTRDGEVDLHVGDEVEVTERAGQYWKGSVRGQTGWFPATHVVELARRKPRNEAKDDEKILQTKSDPQESHTSSAKVKVKGAHGDWRRQILGDLTVMNPSEMLEINRIIRGGIKEIPKELHGGDSQGRRTQLTQLREKFGGYDTVKTASAGPSTKVYTPTGPVLRNSQIKIQVEAPPVEACQEDCVKTEPQPDINLLDVKRPSASSVKSKDKARPGSIPAWAKQFMNTHQPDTEQ